MLNDIGSIFKVENIRHKSYIKTNTENIPSTSSHHNSDQGGSAGLYLGSFNLEEWANIVEAKSEEWMQAGKSLNEQVT
jgi:hypothetical protein